MCVLVNYGCASVFIVFIEIKFDLFLCSFSFNAIATTYVNLGLKIPTDGGLLSRRSRLSFYYWRVITG